MAPFPTSGRTRRTMAGASSFQSRPITVHITPSRLSRRWASRRPGQRTPNGARNNAGETPVAFCDGVLRAGQLVADEIGPAKIELGMRVAVIAHFMAAPRDLARDLRQALHVRAALEEGSGNTLISSTSQQIRRGFAGTIVKRQRDRAPGRRAAIDRWGEQTSPTGREHRRP